MLAAGVAQRLGLILGLEAGFDAKALGRIGQRFSEQGLDLYAVLGGGTPYPYPPGYVPVEWLASELRGLAGLRADQLVRLPAVVAETVLAWLVHRRLTRDGRSAGAALGGAALVALGPSFFLPSGVIGQFDAVVMLVVIAALGATSVRRTGLLLGLAASLKGYPVLFAAALAPRPGGRAVVGWTGAVLVLLTLPFLLATPSDVVAAATNYQPLPGVGGISLVVQPELAGRWAANRSLALSGASQALEAARVATLLSLLGLVAAVALIARWRPARLDAALLVVLVFWVLCTNLYWQYLVWGLPLLLLAGHLREALVLQAVALPGQALIIVGRTERLVDDAPVWVSVVAGASGIATWLVACVLLARHLRRLSPRRPA